MKYIILFEDYNDNNEYYDDEDVIDVPKTTIDGTYYHGTTLNDGDFINSLRADIGDYEAIWFAWEEDVADEFASNHYTIDENMKIMFEVELKSDNIASMSEDLFEEIMDFYGYFDPRESIEILQQQGFDGWKTTGSLVGRVYDDIAIFNDSLVDINLCKLFIDDEWTEYMPLGEAEDIYNEWCEKRG